MAMRHVKGMDDDDQYDEGGVDGDYHNIMIIIMMMNISMISFTLKVDTSSSHAYLKHLIGSHNHKL